MTDPQGTQCLHASCVAVQQRAVLIIGRSGSGKSTLALQMLALGAVLVADDRVLLQLSKGRIWAQAPSTLRGLIEARGLGLLRAQTVDAAEICAVMDLDDAEQDRLPPDRTHILLGQPVTLFRRLDAALAAPALLQYLKNGKHDADTAV